MAMIEDAAFTKKQNIISIYLAHEKQTCMGVCVCAHACVCEATIDTETLWNQSPLTQNQTQGGGPPG